jgi:uncharacterized heparinase superfamily protein
MARLPTLTIPPQFETGVEALKSRLRRFDLTGRRAERAGLYAAAIARIVGDQLRAEWAGSAPHRWLIARPAPQGLAAAPTELRPARPRRGKSIAAGRFVFDGLVLEAGDRLDPWNRPSPSRAFAEGLHAMDWLHDLIAVEGGAPLALRLLQGWTATFGRWNAFAWSGLPLERRVRNLACALKPVLAHADAAGAAALLDSLARQARHLLLAGGPDTRRAERAAAAALAGAVLGGPAGERLLDRALKRLDKALPQTVLPDGGHASRAPEAGLELLLDLKTLDEALAQRGRTAPQELTGALDRLTAAVRRFTLPDGRLVALQGGEESDPARIAAALGPYVPKEGLPASAPDTGYAFLEGGQLTAVVDAGAPASGAWSVCACAQPLAVEVVAGGERLIVSSAWSSRAPSAQALRLTPAASTASVSDSSCGHPLQGWLAKVLGYRLEGAPTQVHSRRHESDGAAWLELSHDGWAKSFGLVHERRLFLDPAADELRGEDQLIPAGEPAARPRRRPVFLIVRFQLHPEVKASLALDHKSILLQPRNTAGGGWWLRNDAPEVSLEPATRLEGGRPHPANQVVLRCLLGRSGTARIRWKLSRADAPPAEKPARAKAGQKKAG